MMAQCGKARLTYAHRLEYAQSRDLRLEATAFVAENETAVPAMVFALVHRESEGSKIYDIYYLNLVSTVKKTKTLTAHDNQRNGRHPHPSANDRPCCVPAARSHSTSRLDHAHHQRTTFCGPSRRPVL